MDVEDYHPVRLVDHIIDWELWDYVIDQYGAPFGQYFIKVLYGIYTHLTFFNMVVFFVKCIPTGVVMLRLIKNATCRERMKLKHLELDELQLQFQIVNAKLSVREADFAEREELLRRRVENLCRVRTRIREIIADDDELRQAVNGNTLWDENNISNSNNTSEEASSENKLLVEFLSEMHNHDEVITSTQFDPEMLSCGEPSSYEPAGTENTVYSSAANGDTKQDFHVKIVKVTNVYRVAYLRQFIKQKRLRRANRQALLKKKMASINQLLEDWQNTLSTVINSTPCMLNNSPQVDLASQEAMGDCSKPNLYNSSDSDSDFINSTDNFHDNYSVSWTQNQYTPIYAYNNCDEYNGDAAIARDYDGYDIREYDNYTCHEDQQQNNRSDVLYVVPEETTSQLEIKEIASDVE